LLSILLEFARGSVAAQAVYRLTDLGTLGGEVTLAYAINSSGQITGTADTQVAIYCYEWGGGISCVIESHAFLWGRGVMTDLGTLGGPNHTALAINDRGQGAGISDTGEPLWCDGEYCVYISHGFRWDGAFYDLGEPGRYCEALSINKGGVVAGAVQLVSGVHDRQAVVWDRTGRHELAAPGVTSSWGTAINDFGQVAGRVYTVDDDSTRPIVWDGATVVEIGSFGGTRGEANDINNIGHVTGWSNVPGDALAHAFVWNGQTLMDIGTLPGGFNSTGYAINKVGYVAGKADISGLGWRAILWDRKQLYDLNDLIDASDALRPFVT